MEALALILAALFILGKGLLVGALIYLPFWLLGRGCTRLGNAMLEKANREQIPK